MNGFASWERFPKFTRPVLIRFDAGWPCERRRASYLKGFCHVDDSQIVRSLDRVDLWNVLVCERRPGVWWSLLRLCDAAKLLCAVGCGSGRCAGDRCSASTGGTEVSGWWTAALSECLSSH